MAETPILKTSLPLTLDPQKVFRQKLQVNGQLPVASLKRLCESLLDEEGTVSASLLFEVDMERRFRIRGNASAEVSVTCQRCLQPMKLQLEDKIDLVLVSTDAQSKALPVNLDPWFCGEDEMLSPADIVEEQLILAMPIVSMHVRCIDVNSAQDETVKNQIESETARKNPFAVLAGLRSRSD
ncbi:MAG: YceD family protein [Pseudohongiella sp.]|nr:YceD family protein [Pseudohongiella sp.]